MPLESFGVALPFHTIITLWFPRRPLSGNLVNKGKQTKGQDFLSRVRSFFGIARSPPYHCKSTNPPEFRFRVLLTDGAPEVRFERVAAG